MLNISGNNTLATNVTVAPKSLGEAGIRSDAGLLTIDGDVDLGYSKLTVSGPGDTSISGTIHGIGVNEFFSGGLVGNYYSLSANGVANDNTAREALIKPDSGQVIGMDALTPQVVLLTPRIDFAPARKRPRAMAPCSTAAAPTATRTAGWG